jgi:alpha-L-rhamnosidase
VWEVTVPPNTTAQIFIPSEPGTDVESDGLVVDRREGRFAQCTAPAGRYRFTSVFRV